MLGEQSQRQMNLASYIFVSSAPGESPPPLSRNNHGTVADIRHDIVRAGTTISEVHRDVMSTRAMVLKILKGQEGVDVQDRFVSFTHVLPATGQLLTAT